MDLLRPNTLRKLIEPIQNRCRVLATAFHTSPRLTMQKCSESHLERTAAEPRENDLHSVMLSKVHQVGPRVRIFRLNLTKPIQFLAGQWLDTYVPQEPKAGGFTIISAPSSAVSPSPYLELAVQDAPHNPAAAWLWRPEADILGQMVQIRVGGSFTCPPAEGLEGVKKIVLVAGGVGVNPLMSMLGYIATEGIDVEVAVLYGSKAEEGGKVVLLDRMLELFGQRLVKGGVRLFLTGKKNIETGMQVMEGVSVDIHSGRMAINTILDEIRDLRDAKAGLVYICGPPAMTDEFVEALTKADMKDMIHPNNVKLEKWW